MVEGPGCKVKGETMKPRIKGMVVVAVSGTAVKKKARSKRTRNAEASVSQSDSKSEFDVLLSHQVADVKTLGKELFIFFEASQLCLRVHFLMSGGYRLNGQKLDGDGGGEADTPTLVLHLTNPLEKSMPSELKFNKSAVDVRPADPSLERIKFLLPLDICYEHFNLQRALSLVLEQRTRQVCDVLLDQQILPGVGNIIKNEALYLSAVKPDTLVSDLSESHLTHLIKMTRDFSMVFYRCRRDGKSLQPHLQIYNKSVCKQCSGRCVTTRLGEDTARLTIFCPSCQDNDFTRLVKRHSGNKNSLLGWMTKHHVLEDWTCPQCTLINNGQRGNCQLCHATRVTTETPRDRPENKIPIEKTASLSYIQDNGHPGSQKENFRSKGVTEACSSSNLERLSDPVGVNRQGDHVSVTKGQKQFRFHRRNSTTNMESIPEQHNLDSRGSVGDTRENFSDNKLSEAVSMDNRNSIKSGMTRNTKAGSDTTSSHLKAPLRSLSGNQANSEDSKSRHDKAGSGPAPRWQPVACLTRASKCDTHKVACIMRQVHKQGDNLHRMFWSCPRRKGCNYFKWADESFPKCEGHKRRSVLRTVYKQGPNNTRRFFACPLGKGKQCGFFQWADVPVT